MHNSTFVIVCLPCIMHPPRGLPLPHSNALLLLASISCSADVVTYLLCVSAVGPTIMRTWFAAGSSSHAGAELILAGPKGWDKGVSCMPLHIVYSDCAGVLLMLPMPHLGLAQLP